MRSVGKASAVVILVLSATGIGSLATQRACAAGNFDGWVESSEYVAGFDGTRLAVTVRRPSAAGVPASARLPVIVTQDRMQSYAQTGRAMRFFTDRGYVWVAQDRRGTGASFGVQKGFVNQEDAQDAKAVIEWAAARPYSSGKVVASGCSNQGAWQYLVATLRPAALVAIAPACSSPQFFDDGVAINGIPMAKVGDKPYAGECNRPLAGARPPGFVPPEPIPVDTDKDGSLLRAAQQEQKCGAAMLGQYWLNMPRDGRNEFAGYRPALQDSALTHWDAVRKSRIAILQLGGWYDAAVAGQLQGQRLWGGRLIMGPWVHGNRTARGARLANAELDLNAETLRWFDLHAKGIANGADKPAIRYYTSNAPAGQEWRDVARWPHLPRTRWYLADESRLLTSRPARDGASVAYPQQDVAWFDGSYQPLGRWWSGDMASADAKSLAHTMAPLAADTEVTGTPTARLWISADAADVNVFAVLEDVSSDGRSTYVTDGRLRASWRKVSDAPWGRSDQTWHRGYASDLAPLVPGKAEALVFDFFPISHVFKAGHRIRVSLATSIGESYQAPPLAGGKPVTLTVYRDARRPSAIELPIR